MSKGPGSVGFAVILCVAAVLWVPVAAQGMANHHPVLSPDARLILFDSDHEGNSEVYVMNVDGSNVRRLTTNPGSDTGMRWSEDGSAIFFRRGAGPGTYPYLYRMNLDGSSVEKVEDETESLWERSADGRLILTGARDGEHPTHAIFVMNADGSGRRPLTSFEDGTVNSNMHFSPDGSTVVYESFVGNASTGQIYIVDLDSSNRRKLASGTDPLWSPDGSAVVFKALNDADRWMIHVIGSDGTGDRTFFEGSHPSWLPDGERILFMAVIDGKHQICLLNVADGTRTQLTR